MRAGKLRLKQGLFRLTVVWTVIVVVVAVAIAGYVCHVDYGRWNRCRKVLSDAVSTIEARGRPPQWVALLQYSPPPEHTPSWYDYNVEYARNLLKCNSDSSARKAEFRSNEDDEWFLANYSTHIQKALYLTYTDTHLAKLAASPRRLMCVLCLVGLVGAVAGVASLWTAIALIWIPYRVIRWIVGGFLPFEPEQKGGIEKTGNTCAGGTPARHQVESSERGSGGLPLP
jgi:hypothetical protein